MNMKLPACPSHPGVFLPHNFTCPLCAQEARQKAYEAQRAERATGTLRRLQQPHRPATGPVEDQS